MHGLAFAWCYRELACERPLSPIVAAHRAAGDRSFLSSVSEVVWFPCPCDQPYFLSNCRCCAKEAYLENGNRSGENFLYTSGRRNVGLFTLPPSACSEICVRSQLAGSRRVNGAAW